MPHTFLLFSIFKQPFDYSYKLSLFILDFSFIAYVKNHNFRNDYEVELMPIISIETPFPELYKDLRLNSPIASITEQHI